MRVLVRGARKRERGPYYCALPQPAPRPTHTRTHTPTYTPTLPHLVRVRDQVGDVHVPALARRLDAHALVDKRELDDEQPRAVEVVGRRRVVEQRAARVARERDVRHLFLEEGGGGGVWRPSCVRFCALVAGRRRRERAPYVPPKNPTARHPSLPSTAHTHTLTQHSSPTWYVSVTSSPARRRSRISSCGRPTSSGLSLRRSV